MNPLHLVDRDYVKPDGVRWLRRPSASELHHTIILLKHNQFRKTHQQYERTLHRKFQPIPFGSRICCTTCITPLHDTLRLHGGQSWEDRDTQLSSTDVLDYDLSPRPSQREGGDCRRPDGGLLCPTQHRRNLQGGEELDGLWEREVAGLDQLPHHKYGIQSGYRLHTITVGVRDHLIVPHQNTHPIWSSHQWFGKSQDRIRSGGVFRKRVRG